MSSLLEIHRITGEGLTYSNVVRMGPELSDKNNGKKREIRDLPTLEERRIREDLITTFIFLEGHNDVDSH